MTTVERQKNRAKKAIGKTMRVQIYKRKNPDEASVFCTGEITEAVYMGVNDDGENIFSVTLVSGKDRTEREVVVTHLPR